MLQRHEGRHGRANAEGSRFVVTGGEDATSIASATHADRFTSQGGLVAHFDRGIKTIHVEMNDPAR